MESVNLTGTCKKSVERRHANTPNGECTVKKFIKRLFNSLGPKVDISGE